jgi:adenylate kinase
MTKKKSGLYLVLTGYPGCGKGTQAKILQNRLGIPHLSSGVMLRTEIKEATPIGMKIKSIIDAGDFAPDDIVEEMIQKRIEKPDCRRGFILDGFPRKLSQAESLLSMMEKKGAKLSAVIDIQVSKEIIEERILNRYVCSSCGQGYHDVFLNPKVYGVCDNCGYTEFHRRIDDNRETIQSRLVNYNDFTYPIVSFFEEKGLLYHVDGTGSIDGVAKKIEELLQNI